MRLASIFITLLTAGTAVAAASSPIALQLGDASQGRFTTVDHGGGGISVSFNLALEAQRDLSQKLASTPDANHFQPPTIVRWIVLPPTGGAEVTVRDGDFQPADRSAGLKSFSSVSNELRSNMARLGRPAIMRGVRMAPLSISPLFKDDTGEWLIADDINLDITFTGAPGVAEVRRPPARLSATYRSLIESSVLNPDSPNLPRRDPAATNIAKMLILRPQTYTDQDGLSGLSNFAEWKRRCGFDVTIRSINATGLSSREIRQVIGEGYPDDPWDFVILIGWDRRYETIQADNALSFPAFHVQGDTLGGDLYYATLDNNDQNELETDYLPDVMIGRMMVPNTAKLLGALNRSILYERNPYPGPQGHEGEWFRHAYLVSDHSADTANNVPFPDKEVATWAALSLQRLGMVTDTLFDKQLTPLNAERAMLQNTGVSVALTQGYMFGAVDIDDPDAFAHTHGMNPLLISTGEYYGEPHPMVYPFFSAATANSPDGPIACITHFGFAYLGGTEYSYYGVANGLAHLGQSRVGDLFFSSAQAELGRTLLFSNDQDSSDWVSYRRLIWEFSVVGDPSVEIYTANPAVLHTDLAQQFHPGATALNIYVTDDDQRGVPYATVCIRQPDVFQYVTQTNGDGEVAFTVPEGFSDGQNVQVTIMKHNYHTLTVDVPVQAADANLRLTESGFDDSQLGDNDGLLRNGETAELLVTYFNDGNAIARNVSAAISCDPDSHFVSFNNRNVQLQDIPEGEGGSFAAPVQITLAPGCPGLDTVRIQIDLSSGDIQWHSALEIATSGPRYEIDPQHVELWDFLPGSHAQLAPTVFNNGNLDGDNLTSHLVSLSDGVTVTQADGEFDAIAARASGVSHPYDVTIDSLFVPGQMANFELHLTGAREGENYAVAFSIPVGSPAAEDPVGPDGHGYLCYDSGDTTNWPEAPKFDWIEINPAAAGGDQHRGTKLFLPDGDQWTSGAENSGSSTVIDLPFAFRYYGQDYRHLAVCSNGWASFDTNAINFHTPLNSPIPGDPAPDAQISACWQDIYNRDSTFNGVYSYYYHDDGMFVLEWSRVVINDTLTQEDGQQGLAPHNVDFQIQLLDPMIYPTESGNGDIIVQYNRFTPVYGKVDEYRYPTIGIRSPDGSDGIQYFHRGRYASAAHPITDQFAIKFTTTTHTPLGVVTGRAVRLEDQQSVLDQVHITHPRGLDLFDDANGRFIFTTRSGIYPNTQMTRAGFNTVTLDLNVRTNDTLDLGDISFPHPSLAAPSPVSFGLRPGYQTTAPILLANSGGSGPLDYQSRISYSDGSETNFDTLKTYPICTLLFNSSKTYAPLWHDNHFYIGFINGLNNCIGVIDRSGDTVQVINQFLGDSLEKPFYFMDWDGRHFWGEATINAEPRIIEFDLGGNVYRIIKPPEAYLNDLASPIAYSPERNSLFFAQQQNGKPILEFSLRDENFGEIVNEFPIEVPPDEFTPTGLAWNPYDPDGMPLYILHKPRSSELPQQLLLRANPDTHHYEQWRILPGRNGKSAWGLCITDSYDRDNLCLILNEDAGSTLLTDKLRVMKLAPNTSFLVGGLQNAAGSVPPGGSASIDMHFALDNSFAKGEYQFGVKITHNALGGVTVVPVTMTVSDTASVGDGGVGLPVEFGIRGAYPNPFNGMLAVKFMAPKGKFASVRLYDIAGRDVATLFEGTSAGTQRAIWEANDAPSGIYILRLESAGRVAQSKVVLVK